MIELTESGLSREEMSCGVMLCVGVLIKEVPLPFARGYSPGSYFGITSSISSSSFSDPLYSS